MLHNAAFYDPLKCCEGAVIAQKRPAITSLTGCQCKSDTASGQKDTGATKEKTETATRAQSTYINMKMLEFLLTYGLILRPC